MTVATPGGLNFMVRETEALRDHWGLSGVTAPPGIFWAVTGVQGPTESCRRASEPGTRAGGAAA